MHYKSHS